MFQPARDLIQKAKPRKALEWIGRQIAEVPQFKDELSLFFSRLQKIEDSDRRGFSTKEENARDLNKLNYSRTQCR